MLAQALAVERPQRQLKARNQQLLDWASRCAAQGHLKAKLWQHLLCGSWECADGQAEAPERHVGAIAREGLLDR